MADGSLYASVNGNTWWRTIAGPRALPEADIAPFTSSTLCEHSIREEMPRYTTERHYFVRTWVWAGIPGDAAHTAVCCSGCDDGCAAHTSTLSMRTPVVVPVNSGPRAFSPCPNSLRWLAVVCLFLRRMRSPETVSRAAWNRCVDCCPRVSRCRALSVQTNRQTDSPLVCSAAFEGSFNPA